MQVSRRKTLSPFLGLTQPEQPVNSHDSHIRISVSAAQQSCQRIRAPAAFKAHRSDSVTPLLVYAKSSSSESGFNETEREKLWPDVGKGEKKTRGWFCFLRSHGICPGREPRTRLGHRNCTRKTKIKGTRW